MGTTIDCSCCHNEDKRMEIRYGEKQYSFKIMASFILIFSFLQQRIPNLDEDKKFCTRDDKTCRDEKNPLKRRILLNEEDEVGNVKIIIPCLE